MVPRKGYLFNPSLKMVIGIPSGSTPVEMRAVRDSAEQAGGRDGGDGRRRQQGPQVVGLRVPDGSVVGPPDGAAPQHVPHGDAVPEQKGPPFLRPLGRLLPEQGCQNRPHAVLGVAIVELRLPGSHRGEGSQDQNFGVLIIHRFKGLHLY